MAKWIILCGMTLAMSAACVSASDSSPTADKHAKYITNDVPTMAFEIAKHELNVAIAPEPLVVPPAPAVVYDLVVLDLKTWAKDVEPRCNGPTA